YPAPRPTRSRVRRLSRPTLGCSDHSPQQQPRLREKPNPTRLERRKPVNSLALLLGVCLGAGIGAQMRYGLDVLFAHRPPVQQPIATLTANIIGSGLIGVMVAVLDHMDLVGQPPWWSQILTAGV